MKLRPHRSALFLVVSLTCIFGVRADVPPPSPGPSSTESVLPDTGLARADYEYRAHCAPRRVPDADPLRCLELQANVAEAEAGQAEGCLSAGWLMSGATAEHKGKRLEALNASSAEFIRLRETRCGDSPAPGDDERVRRERLQCRISINREHTAEILAEANSVRHDACWAR